MRLDYEFPVLYEEQAKAINCDQRYSVIEASTKSGKTYGCIIWLLNKATAHSDIQVVQSGY